MSTQRGPVEPGRPPGEPVPMDVDRALAILDGEVYRGDGRPVDPMSMEALAALRLLAGTARRYVRGRTVGRFLELARALQETPDVDRGSDVSEAQVERFLVERGQMRITVDVAQRLGLWIPPAVRGVPPGQ